MGNALRIVVILSLVAVTSCSINQHDPVADLAMVQRLYAEGDYQGAVDGYERLVQQVPQDGELWFRLANGYVRLGQPEAAISAYRNALLRNPDQAKAWYNLAEVHLQMALQVYVEAETNLHPDDPLLELLQSRRKRLMEVMGTDAVMER